MDKRRGWFALFLDYLRFLFCLGIQKEIHSPLVFAIKRHIYTSKISKTNRSYAIKHRTHLLKQTDKLVFLHPSSGNVSERKIKDIAAKDAKPKFLSWLIYRLVTFLKPKNLLEGGTSLGISSLYQAMAMPDQAVFTTIEGAKAISDYAYQHFPKEFRDHVQFSNVNIQEFFERSPETGKPYDWFFIDADHRYASLKNIMKQAKPWMSERAFVLIDDIRWSKGMKQAWNELKNESGVAYSIDFFFMGLLIYQPNTAFQHFYISPVSWRQLAIKRLI